MQPRKPFERRWELPGRTFPFYDYPTSEFEVANSLFWYCSFCGVRYAEVRSWKNAIPATWHGIRGCCPDCPGNRFSLSGSIESMYLLRLSLPAIVYEYQLSVEMKFLSSKDHPHNVES